MLFRSYLSYHQGIALLLTRSLPNHEYTRMMSALHLAITSISVMASAALPHHENTRVINELVDVNAVSQNSPAPIQ